MKKGRQNFWPGKSEIFPENRKFFRLESKIYATGFTTPQTSNQIDAADRKKTKNDKRRVLCPCVTNSYCPVWDRTVKLLVTGVDILIIGHGGALVEATSFD